MINIPLIGTAAALVVCALIAKALARKPKKASKSQKGEILKQLLELSERENRSNATASSPALRLSRPNQSARSANGPRIKQQPVLRPRSNNRLTPAGGNSSVSR